MKNQCASVHCLHSRKGFSLIEAAIVLGVVGLVIGGIWVAAAAVSEHRKLNQAIAQIEAILENVRHLYGARPPAGYTNLMAASALFSSIFPADAIPNNIPTTPWGSGYAVTIDNNNIIITFSSGLGVSACKQLAPRVLGLLSKINRDSNLVQIIFPVNDAVVDDPTAVIAWCQMNYDTYGDSGFQFEVPY